MINIGPIIQERRSKVGIFTIAGNIGSSLVDSNRDSNIYPDSALIKQTTDSNYKKYLTYKLLINI